MNWEQMENTQLETGQFVDLFMTSDAMVHDSGSFAVEYHYSQRPVMFVARDLPSVMTDVSMVGKEAYDVCYIGSSESDIRHFIEDVVLCNDDSLKARRHVFFSNYLLPILREQGYKGSERTLRNYLHMHPNIKALFEKRAQDTLSAGKDTT